jgi:serine/tyrosine/threonine adenylyltransferase
LTELLQLVETDMTIFFRNLGDVLKDDTTEVTFNKIENAFYDEKDLTETIIKNWHTWLNHYTSRINEETITDMERKQQMNSVNPKYVLRNYMAQLSINAADEGNYSLINELFELLKKPYDEQPDKEQWFAKRPDWARNKVGCSMLSCSS